MILLTDVFPMSVQGVCVGVIEGLAQVGCLLGPIIINICISSQIHPVLLLSLISIFTNFIPLFFVPSNTASPPPLDLEKSLLEGEGETSASTEA